MAELASAFCCAALGITPTVRHSDYIGAWIETMREETIRPGFPVRVIVTRDIVFEPYRS